MKRLPSSGAFSFLGGQYCVKVPSAPAGSIMRFSGLDEFSPRSFLVLLGAPASSEQTAMLMEHVPHVAQLVPLSLMKVAIEPIVPSNAPKMLAGLQELCKTVPGAT